MKFYLAILFVLLFPVFSHPQQTQSQPQTAATTAQPASAAAQPVAAAVEPAAAVSQPTAAQPAPTKAQAVFPDPTLFPMPQGYEPNVEFWMRVYGEWGDDQMAIHDAHYMNVVLDVVRVPGENMLLRSAVHSQVMRRVDQLHAVLLDLARDPASKDKSDEHKRLYALYEHIKDPNKFQIAAENLRIQQGIRDRFRQGLIEMTRYLPSIKQALRDVGVPDEIAYLPLVESSFNNRSLSKTRAAGIWQFMPGTARHYMKVNRDVDERLDPYVATRAAATYLKQSYNMFGKWPVSIMSYNHGQAGVGNAIRSVGTNDFMTIYKNYNGRLFKFASKNFYAEYLAACKVMDQAEKYFGKLDYASPQRYEAVTLSKPLWASTVLNHSSLTREDLRNYNPALQSSVIFSKRPIPAGYVLRLPAGLYRDPDNFIAQLRSQDAVKKVVAATDASSEPPAARSTRSADVSDVTYVVRRGDTLFSISRRFSTSVDDIRRLNRLDHNRIHPGQRLLIGAR